MLAARFRGLGISADSGCPGCLLWRKNWLFAGSETAGKRAAAIMSLLATAKANGIEPHAWLTDVLTRLPTTLDRDIGDLLPNTWKPARP